MYGIADRVRFPNQYEYNMGALDSEYMAMIYSASDVLVMPSHCEGFGVPLIEAQACGLPVVTVAYSAMPELTFKGETVEDYLCYTIHPGREVAIVDGDSFWCTMACVLRTGMNDTKREAPKQVSDYEIGKVYKHYMAPILKMVQDNPSLLENKKGQGI
jgi:glycosyltransferase involved in cell wall biosynthesis